MSNYKLLTRCQEMVQVCDLIAQQQFVSIDTEYIPRPNNRPDFFGISICPTIGTAYFILKADMPKILRIILESDAIRKYGHNIKAEIQSLSSIGVGLRGTYFDTMIASYIIDPTREHKGLKDLAREELGIEMEDLTKWFKTGKTFADYYNEYPEKAINYACADADMTLRLAKKYKPIIDKDFKSVFYDVDMPLVPILAQMEMHGIRIDREFLKTLGVKYNILSSDIEGQLIKEGTPFIK